MKYFFILGRNPELSKQEILSYLKRTENKAKNYTQKNNSILIDVKNKIEDNAIDKLGGIISIGKVLTDNENKKLYSGNKNKINYIIWNFSNKIDEFRKMLKDYFKKEKIKATEKKLSRIIEMQSGEKSSTFSSKKIDEQYFIFENYFGKIIQTCDYKKIEKRDMEKPIRRSELSISPRLAKIMINLSEIKKGKLIDAFCGIGVILQEALLQGISVIGVDKDKKALEDAKKNLEWFGFSKENYKLIKADSRKVKIPEAEVFVTEPDLGEILKKIPTEKKAQEILKKFENLIISVINNLKNKIKGRLVLTTPFIKTMHKRISCNADYIAKKTNLSIILKIPEFRKNQIVGREIFHLKIG